MRTQIFLLILMLVLPAHLAGIQNSSDPKEEPKPPNIMEEEILSPASTSHINVTERQRRLIPYMTFYLTQNRPSNHIQDVQEPVPQQYRIIPQKISVEPYPGKIILVNQVNEPNPVIYQPKVRYTPFLESNKLPGGFTPMRNPNQHPIRVQVLNPQVQQVQPVVKEPNYSTIFDKLLQLKQIQYTKGPQYETIPQYQNPKTIATQYYTRNYVTPRPSKYITVEDFQAENYKQVAPTKTYIHTYTPANIDISNENKVQNYEHFEPVKTYNQIPAPVAAKEYAQNYQEPEPIQPGKNYEPIIFRPIYRPVPVTVNPYRPVYQSTEATTPAYTSTENPHSLSVILKQLQDSNTLPQTLTPDNIDNSIKTLVQILNALKHTQKFQSPIVVTEDSAELHPQENIDDYDDSILPETVSHSYPANTPEGGTPGKPGVDYPAYSFIPQTNFNCKKQRYKGFFGDPDTNCQVWHYCDLNGGQASFLCPNGTIFSQVALTCDWWYNVKCATTTQLYVLNERLYKYILPFTPKFPEDYSGPLVDRYLALKFKEMEEKMKKQKKGKTEKPASNDVQDDSQVNTLEDIEGNSEVESVAESQEHVTKTSQDNKDSR